MKRVTKIGLASFIKFQTITWAIIGFICGCLYAFGGLLLDTLVTFGLYSTHETQGLSVGTILAFGALLGMPLIGALGGFILGILEGLLFNVFSKLFGGINMDVE